jgi:WD40 repeat protein
MEAGSNSTGPDAAGIIRDLDALLDGFDAADVTFLTPQGVWSRSPGNLRDRISNELVFRLWQARMKPGWPEVAVRLFTPLLEIPETRRIRAPQTADDAARESSSQVLVALLETLLVLVEHQVHAAGAGAYTADWDFAGKARRRLCQEQAGLTADRMGRMFGPAGGRLAEIGASLRASEQAVFGKTVETVAAEEAFRWEMRGWLASALNPKEGGIDTSAGQDAQRGISISRPIDDSLVRPCLELLLKEDLEVTSGVQFQVSDVLGRLKDPRTMGGMLTALETIAAGHTGIRANLIYALGNLKQRGCLHRFVNTMESPDSVAVLTPAGQEYRQPLEAEKCEAIWALGKLGEEAAEAIPSLVACADSMDLDIRLHLAWALGTIGFGQKRATGGLDSDVVITLMRLIRQGDSTLFEEAASGLKHLGLPDVLHTLYLHDFGTLPVLSLKPSSIGIYEISETILHLVSVKRPVVMAVTGDSGTGKTYFCEVIAEGFSDIGGSEIVYLKRDTIGDRTLDRIVGLEWLRSHVEPRFYDPYPVPEDQDDPDRYFDEFIRACGNKKLIILDGWRDQAYFNRIIEVFYEKGHLDLLVHFRTTFSTRRLNLEEREASLERVKLHLPLVEEPGIEETSFYREGAVLVYNLDNSIPSRLDKDGIREVFNRRKVDSWADQIRIGSFTADRRPLPAETHALAPVEEKTDPDRRLFKAGEVTDLKVYETTFTRMLNDDLDACPHLLQTVTAGDLAVHRIAFYTQGQIAFSGHQGTVGVLVGFNDRVFYARPHRSVVRALAVTGREIYSVGDDGCLKALSFERSTARDLGKADSPTVALAGHRDGRVVTGHVDGSVRIWDAETGQVTLLRIHDGPVCCVVIDRRGRIYSGGTDGKVCAMDAAVSAVRAVSVPESRVVAVAPYVDGRLAVATGRRAAQDGRRGSGGGEIFLLDPQTGRSLRLTIPHAGDPTSMSVYFDGRLVIAFESEDQSRSGSRIAVVDPNPDAAVYTILGGHEVETGDCITMGPRIISCGTERGGAHTLKIWGTAAYVASEHAKARFLPASMPKPPYYRSLF